MSFLVPDTPNDRRPAAMTIAEHPSIRRYRDRPPSAPAPAVLDAEELSRFCREMGADDAGFVSVDRPEIADQKADILSVFPAARTLISFVLRMNRENIRSPARSLANLEFHGTGDRVNEVSHRIVAALAQRGVRALYPAMGFPMELERWPGKIWVIAHKPVAVAAGLGHMGIHRNVIHPRFGNFILLGTVAVAAEVSAESSVLDYNPCLECKLCVSACPVGAIGNDGSFNFFACLTHNYREFLGGFSDWIEGVVESGSVREYRRRTSDAETASMWQSLSFSANYKAAYCLAVCPAGDDVLPSFVDDRKGYVAGVVRPLQDRKETIYVLAGTDAEAHVARRFPNKRAKVVRSGVRVRTIERFLHDLPFVFQKGQAKGVDLTYHFTFTGGESVAATVVVRNQAVQVTAGHQGQPDLHLTADSTTWLRFLAHDTSLAGALLRRKIRLRGSPRHLLTFGRCFRS
jgi:Fe-S-cluster-containing hydrogenase component 2